MVENCMKDIKESIYHEAIVSALAALHLSVSLTLRMV